MVVFLVEAGTIFIGVLCPVPKNCCILIDVGTHARVQTGFGSYVCAFVYFPFVSLSVDIERVRNAAV